MIINKSPLATFIFSMKAFVYVSAVIAVLVVAPLFAHATPPTTHFVGGDGSPGDPYQIATCAGFEEINTYLGSSFELIADLNCTSRGNNMMIGDGSVIAFTGTLDGNNHTITIAIDLNENVVGLFRNTDGATITNVLIAGTVKGNNTLGGLAGITLSSTLQYIGSSVTVTSYNNNGDLTGGLVGKLQGSTISQSYATGNVTAGGYAIGGLVGSLFYGASVTNSYATGAVSGDTDVGGLVGKGDTGAGTISKSYSTGTVSGVLNVGGLIGEKADATISDNYFDVESSGINASAGCGDQDCTSTITGLTTAEIKDYATFNPNPENYGFALSGTQQYRYVKWEITKVRNGADTDCSTGNVCAQASEFNLLTDGYHILTPGNTTATNPSGYNISGLVASHLVDGNTGTKWIDGVFSYSNQSTGLSTIIFDAGSGNSYEFNGYNWATGNDQDQRDPVSWVLSGSTNGTDWTVVDTQDDFSPTLSRQVFVRPESSVSWDFYQTWDINGVTNSGYPFLVWQLNYPAPTIISTSPIDTAINQAVDVPLVITFSVPMDPNLVSVDLTPCGGPCLSYTSSWNSDYTVFTINVANDPFLNGTTYTATVSGTSTAAVTLTGANTFAFTIADNSPVLTQVRPITAFTTLADAQYYFSVSDGIDQALNDNLGNYQATVIQGVNHPVEFVIDPINHIARFTGLEVGDRVIDVSFSFIYYSAVDDSNHIGAQSNELHVGPFKVIPVGGAVLLPNATGGLYVPSATYSPSESTSPTSDTPSTTTKTVKEKPFLKNLKRGMDDVDVARLQHYLALQGFPVATTGQGSLGKEVTTFGSKTAAALAKFQKANKITPASGYLGPKTRGYINEHL